MQILFQEIIKFGFSVPEKHATYCSFATITCKNECLRELELYRLFLVNCKHILYERRFSKNTFKAGQEKTVMISVTTWNVFARGEERKPVGNRSTTLIPTSWWNTGFIFAYHCKMGWQTILDEANEPTDFIRLRIFDPKEDWTTKNF